eukprot:9728214-Alexandrium_andersonii.AAC.1
MLDLNTCREGPISTAAHDTTDRHCTNVPGAVGVAMTHINGRTRPHHRARIKDLLDLDTWSLTQT